VDLTRYRIWDCLFVPNYTGPGTLEREVESLLRLFDQFGIERTCAYFPIGMEAIPGRREPEDSAEILRCLARWPARLFGGAILNASFPERCLDNLERWVRDGPMVAAIFPSSPKTLPCNHPNFDRIVRRAHELGVLILQHTWWKAGGKGSVGESTPLELVELARRHPDITFVCVHAGGEWEKGLRAIRDSANILIETSGFDPTAGFLERAVRELGAERILYGRERGFGTELAKVLGADIPDTDRQLIFGGNLRRLLGPILTRKGWAPS